MNEPKLPVKVMVSESADKLTRAYHVIDAAGTHIFTDVSEKFAKAMTKTLNENFKIIAYHTHLKKLDQRIAELKAEKEALIKETTQSCKHPVDALVESRGMEDSIGYRLPFRVCTDCGLGEYGYSYKVLKAEHSKDVSLRNREESFAYHLMWNPTNE